MQIDHSNFWRKHMQMYKILALFFSLGTHALVSANPTLLKEAGQTVSPSGIECQIVLISIIPIQSHISEQEAMQHLQKHSLQKAGDESHDGVHSCVNFKCKPICFHFICRPAIIKHGGL